nr:variable surface lipoprotein [Mycoplasmopsis bovis]
MKSINKLLISAVSAISLAMPLVAASCGVTKPSEQGSGSKHRHKNIRTRQDKHQKDKPSEQGSGTNSEKNSEQGSRF